MKSKLYVVWVEMGVLVMGGASVFLLFSPSEMWEVAVLSAKLFSGRFSPMFASF